VVHVQCTEVTSGCKGVGVVLKCYLRNI
jgi:hypothetical protein